MDHHDTNDEVFRSSPLMVLVTYTVLGAALIAETILMSWELWAIPIIAASIIICWGIHLTQFMSINVRIWICTVLMMSSFFFYGIHITSVYDMPLVMMLVIMIYTTTGQAALVTVCQLTYFFTLGYDIFQMINTGTDWDRLLISRTILHIVLMFMCGWLAKLIIKRWSSVFHKSDEEIKELNESTARMNSFMANLSHELRTPINAILGITNVMLDNEDNEELKRDMHEVILAGHRMAEQVGDILDYSEIEMNRLVVNTGNYMIASVLNDLVTQIRPMIPANLELVIDVDAEVPSVLKGDSRKLHKILYHLISNGLRYTKEGGVSVRISSKKQNYGINLCIEVTDTGVGMSKDELDRIYNRFYQAESGRIIRSGGLGISMVIVSGFVRSLGGFITIDSEPDKGTIVKISIPQAVEDESRCMSVDDKEVINLAGFLNIGKFTNPNVREFYNSMILNLVRGLRTSMHRVDNIDDLRKLTEKIKITHLFVADEEYDKNRDYIESLAAGMEVIVVAKESFSLPKRAKAHILLKPFYCIPIVSILNSNKKNELEAKRMYCRGIKALVVDDEPMNLNVAKGIFKRYGMQVFTAGSGAESVKMCKEADYDIVFMDHMMPGMDGVEAMKQIRYDAGKAKKDFPIVALTANALSTAKEMFISEGFDGFVSKPVEMSELERVLKHVLPEDVISYEDDKGVTANRIGFVSDKSISDLNNLSGNDINGNNPNFEMIRADEYDIRRVKEAKKKENIVEKDNLSFESCGIDRNAAMKYCQDEELFESLLVQYSEESEEKIRNIEKYYADRDAENYSILVHALKSTSLMIGNISLSEEAKAMEKAGKEQNFEFIEQNHDSLMKHYKKTVACINNELSRFQDTQTAESEPVSDNEFEILEFAPSGRITDET